MKKNMAFHGQPPVNPLFTPNDRRATMLAFCGILAALFLFSLNQTIIAAILPRVITDLQGFHLYAWAFTSFTIASTVTIPVCGSLSDQYGRRGLLLMGLVLFTVGTVLAGTVTSMTEFIAYRAVQGVGGGAIMSMAFTATADLFPPRERGKYQGVNAGIFSISSVLGPLAGGLITDAFGWRWAFFVNVPLSLVVFFVIYRFFKDFGPRKKRHLPIYVAVDMAGVGLLLALAIPILLVLSLVNVTFPLLSPQILSLASLSAVAFVLFIFWEKRHPSPILNLAMFTTKTMRTINMATALTSVCMYCAIIYVPLFLQGVHGLSSASSGAVLTPLILGMTGASMASGLLVSRLGRYKALILLGMLLTFTALATMVFFGSRTSMLVIVMTMIVLGMGLGAINSLLTFVTQLAAERSQLGMATGANQFSRQMGGSLGVAIAGAILAVAPSWSVLKHLPPAFAKFGSRTLSELTSPSVLTSADKLAQARDILTNHGMSGSFDAYKIAMEAALTDVIHLIFCMCSVLVIIAFVGAIQLPVLDVDSHQTRS